MDDDIKRGPVRILCEEIEFPFTPQLEHPRILISFVARLVLEVDEMREFTATTAPLTGKSPSDLSRDVLSNVWTMLSAPTADMITQAAGVHQFIDAEYQDDAYPCDHVVDMLNACVSAIRFGLETPCRSRHAADAACQIWAQKYGVKRFDRNTGAWGKDWARKILISALVTLAMSALSDAADAPPAEGIA